MAEHSAKADEAYKSPPRVEEDAPPAYEDLSRPQSTAFGTISRPPSSVFSDASLPGNMTLDNSGPSFGRPFPVAFNLYSDHKWRSWTRRCFHLGEHAERPTNAVIFTTSWKGNNLSLHQGPDRDSPLLALAARDSTWSKHSAITLPGHTDANGEAPRMRLHTNIAWNSGTVIYSFAVDVRGPDEKVRAESFEWRLSHGKEVQDIDTRAWGYKLVRLGPSSEPGSKDDMPPAGSSREAREHGKTSDGKEVVAVYADRSKASKNKFARFAFVGSGARGELGEQWSLMAVVSFLRVWQSVNPALSGGV